MLINVERYNYNEHHCIHNLLPPFFLFFNVLFSVFVFSLHHVYFEALVGY